VLSFTNMSLLPLELLSAGCIPVVNGADNNTLVSDNPYIVYADPAPHALARALADVAERPDQGALARAASHSVQALDWDQSGARVERILLDGLRTPTALTAGETSVAAS
jgi:YD repeat-containing protein